MLPEKKPLAIIGVGNTIAGDDGAGVEVVRRLRKELGAKQGIFLHTLEGDHFDIADLLDRAERFIFVDAVEGELPGELVFKGNLRRAFAPSFHQTDVAAVMNSLEALGVADPFPPWELWGVTIRPPAELGEGLTPVVEVAVERLCQRLREEIEITVGEVRGNAK